MTDKITPKKHMEEDSPKKAKDRTWVNEQEWYQVTWTMEPDDHKALKSKALDLGMSVRNLLTFELEKIAETPERFLREHSNETPTAQQSRVVIKVKAALYERIFGQPPARNKNAASGDPEITEKPRWKTRDVLLTAFTMALQENLTTD